MRRSRSQGVAGSREETGARAGGAGCRLHACNWSSDFFPNSLSLLRSLNLLSCLMLPVAAWESEARRSPSSTLVSQAGDCMQEERRRQPFLPETRLTLASLSPSATPAPPATLACHVCR